MDFCKQQVQFGEKKKIYGELLRPNIKNKKIENHYKEVLHYRQCLIIFTHPHSKLGGNIDNNVIHYISHFLALKGFSILIFNFRGVGKSQGKSTWCGHSETEDFRSAVNFGLAISDVNKVFLCGYSMGSAIGCAASEGLAGYIAISYPYSMLLKLLFNSLYSKADSSIPKLFLHGNNDQFSSEKSIQTFFNKLKEPKELVILKGFDHFWNGSEKILCEHILNFLKSNSY